jgi:hypothetical protein
LYVSSVTITNDKNSGDLLDDAVKQIQLMINPEAGVSYEIFARKVGDANQKDVGASSSGQMSSNDGTGTNAYYNTATVLGTWESIKSIAAVANDIPAIVEYWTPPASRQLYEYKVVASKTGLFSASSSNLDTVTANGYQQLVYYNIVSLKDRLIDSSLSAYVSGTGTATTVSLSGISTALLAGETVEVWGLLVTNLSGGNQTYAEKPEKLGTFSAPAVGVTSLVDLTPATGGITVPVPSGGNSYSYQVTKVIFNAK